MANVTYLFKKVRNSSGWGGWTQLGGQTVDYVSTSTFCVVYGVGLSMEGSETLNSLSVSTNFVSPTSSDNPTTANCYLYTLDPTTSGAASPPSGYVASATQSFSASAAGKYVTFNFSGLSIPSTTMVYVWFTSSVQYSGYGNNQIYHYATGNGNTQTPAAYIGTSGGSSGGDGWGGSGDTGIITPIPPEDSIDVLVSYPDREGIISITGTSSWYSLGEMATLSIQIEDGYEFLGWYRIDDSSGEEVREFVTNNTTFSFTVTGNTYFDVEIRRIPKPTHKLTVIRGSNTHVRVNNAEISSSVYYAEYNLEENSTASLYMYSGSGTTDDGKNGLYDIYGNMLCAPHKTYSYTVTEDKTIIVRSVDKDYDDNYYVTAKIEGVNSEGIESVSGDKPYVVGSNGVVTSVGARPNEILCLHATVKPGYKFDGWYRGNYSGAECYAKENPYLMIMGTSSQNLLSDYLPPPPVFSSAGSYNATVYARATGPYYTISAQSGDGVKFVDGEGEYIDGGQCTLSATVSSEYVFSGWYSGSSLVSTSNPYTFTVNGDKTFTAKATIKKYTVTVNKGNYISSVSGSGTYEYGAVCTVSAVAQSGYELQGWYNSNNELMSTDKSYAFNVVDNIKLTAKGIGAVNYRSVNVTNETGISSVSGTGIYSYRTGETAPSCTLTATVADHYTFSGWYSGDSLVSSLNPYTFTVSANKDFVARASIDKHTVTLNKGSGISSVSGGGSHNYGSSCTVSAVVQSGYEFDGWYNNSGERVSTNASFTFNISENISLTAKAIGLPNNVMVNVIKSTGVSSVSGGGAFSYITGEIVPSCTVSATVEDGYNFNAWYTADSNGNPSSYVSSANPYTFKAQDITLVAVAAKLYTVTIIKDEGISSSATTAQYEYGKSVSFQASTPSGYGPVWYKNGALVLKGTSYMFSVVEDTTIEIKSEKMYSVSVTKDAGISSVSGDTYYYANQSCVLSASVNTGYNFNGWYENNALVTDSPTYTFTVTADRQFSAFTAIKEYTITPVTSTGVTYVAGGGIFTHGQECTLSAVVEQGYVFYGWFVDGALFSNSNPATFAVTKDVLLEAVATTEIIDTSWDLDTREKWIYSGESESITRAFGRNTVICVPFTLGPNCIAEQTVIIESISSMDLIGYLSISSDFDNNKGKPVEFLITDDDSGDNGNFKIEYTVAPGVDYYIWSRPYASDESGSVTLSVELKSSNEPSEPDVPEIPDIPIVPETPVVQTKSRKYYTTKIYTGGSWQTVIPYIFENGQWVRMTSVIYHEEE